MFQVSDTVLYGTYGVCIVAEITSMEVKGKITDYYVLKPIYDDSSKVFVPTKNKALTEKMRPVLSKEEIRSIIDSMPDEQTTWIENDAQRKDIFNQILSDGDRHRLVELIKTLYMHQQSQKENGRKLHIADENFLKEAEKMLYEEFAHVLNIERDAVLPFIFEQIESR